MLTIKDIIAFTMFFDHLYNNKYVSTISRTGFFSVEINTWADIIGNLSTSKWLTMSSTGLSVADGLEI